MGYISKEYLNIMKDRRDVRNLQYPKAPDIFALGCVIHFVSTKGKHPFGEENILRDDNIKNNQYKLDESLDYITSELIKQMINENPGFRPDIGSVKNYPLFWEPEKRFGFLHKAFNLINRDNQYTTKLNKLCEEYGNKFAAFDKKFLTFMERKTRYKRYRYDELLRFIRNAYEHYKDLPSEWQFGSLDKLWESYIEPKSLNILLRTYYIMNDFRENAYMKEYYDQSSSIPVLAHWSTSQETKNKRKIRGQQTSTARTSNSNNNSKRFKREKQQTATVPTKKR
jgi:serine/threonine protein kinase